MSKRKYTLGQPHLLLRRGNTKLWTGWLNCHEVSLGTADREQPQHALHELTARPGLNEAAAVGVEAR